MGKTMKIEKEAFVNPPAEFRGAPFWAWNGKLNREELLRQIHILKDMGMGGFFMHSRAGLQTEYLGDEWMELIRICSEEAEKLGMKAYLYDEDVAVGDCGRTCHAESKIPGKIHSSAED